MIDKNTVVEAVTLPMQRYFHTMTRDIADWQPLEDAAERLLQGNDVPDEQLCADFRPLVKMMRLIMRLSGDGAWDWSNPEIRKVFQEVADGAIYTLFADTVVDMVISIMKEVPIGTLVEVGTGPGTVTAALCNDMIRCNLQDVPLIISDRAPTIAHVGQSLRQQFPGLAVTDIIWDIQNPCSSPIMKTLRRPVLVFERFCMPYADYAAIDSVARIADILILIDDLSITGKKYSFDMIYEKIGTKFLVFDTARKHLEQYFSCVHTCDGDTIKAVHSPVTTFTLAVK